VETKITKIDWLFLIICLLLGVIAEEALFRGEIGVSYIIFIAAFYGAFFWRFRKFPFSHQRFGYLMLICIWLLSASYFVNDTKVFNVLNFLAIPCLVLFHLAVVTSPKNLGWNRLGFIPYFCSRVLEALKYNFVFASLFSHSLKKRTDDSKLLVWRKVAIGMLISIPVLLVVMKLLMSADTEFERLVGGIPDWFLVIDGESVARLVIILFCTCAFFAYMQVLLKKHIKVVEHQKEFQLGQLDAVIAITVLAIINIVYILFTIVQFKYFFSGTLQGNFTYAEYARKGFFELLFVTLINLFILVFVLTFVNWAIGSVKRLMQIMLTVLILASSVMLCSAFLRLGLYEDAYGFTITRVLAHSFMIFLTVIFAYTLVKIWIGKLSLFHFYFISFLLYYTAISSINIDSIVVKENIARYETSGKIDVQYLDSMSYTGINGLIKLYEKNKDIPELKTVLQNRKNEALTADLPWQSYNLRREAAFAKLKKLNLED
jgi:hypothetical protein